MIDRPNNPRASALNRGQAAERHLMNDINTDQATEGAALSLPAGFTPHTSDMQAWFDAIAAGHGTELRNLLQPAELGDAMQRGQAKLDEERRLNQVETTRSAEEVPAAAAEHAEASQRRAAAETVLALEFEKDAIPTKEAAVKRAEAAEQREKTAVDRLNRSIAAIQARRDELSAEIRAAAGELEPLMTSQRAAMYAVIDAEIRATFLAHIVPLLQFIATIARGTRDHHTLKRLGEIFIPDFAFGGGPVAAIFQAGKTFDRSNKQVLGTLEFPTAVPLLDASSPAAEAIASVASEPQRLLAALNAHRTRVEQRAAQELEQRFKPKGIATSLPRTRSFNVPPPPPPPARTGFKPQSWTTGQRAAPQPAAASEANHTGSVT